MDVDIDFPTSFDPLDIFNDAIRASMVNKHKFTKHPAGVYFQKIPVDGASTFSAIPYKEAEDLGYMKIDFLHLSVLDVFENKQQVRGLLKKEPDWDLLQDADVVSKLFQIHRRFDVLERIRPRSVQELADCIALIRPGKRFLMDKYVAMNEIERKSFRKHVLYAKIDDEYYFKRSHSIAYALTIVLQLHLIKANII